MYASVLAQGVVRVAAGTDWTGGLSLKTCTYGNNGSIHSEASGIALRPRVRAMYMVSSYHLVKL